MNIARSAALLAMCGLAVPLATAAAAESGAETAEVPTTVVEASLRAARTAAVPLSPAGETTGDAAAAPLTAPAPDYADDQFERLNETALQKWWRYYQQALERAE